MIRRPPLGRPRRLSAEEGGTAREVAPADRVGIVVVLKQTAPQLADRHLGRHPGRARMRVFIRGGLPRGLRRRFVRTGGGRRGGRETAGAAAVQNPAVEHRRRRLPQHGQKPVDRRARVGKVDVRLRRAGFDRCGDIKPFAAARERDIKRTQLLAQQLFALGDGRRAAKQGVAGADAVALAQLEGRAERGIDHESVARIRDVDGLAQPDDEADGELQPLRFMYRHQPHAVLAAGGKGRVRSGGIAVVDVRKMVEERRQALVRAALERLRKAVQHPQVGALLLAVLVGGGDGGQSRAAVQQPEKGMAGHPARLRAQVGKLARECEALFGQRQRKRPPADSEEGRRGAAGARRLHGGAAVDGASDAGMVAPNRSEAPHLVVEAARVREARNLKQLVRREAVNRAAHRGGDGDVVGGVVHRLQQRKRQLDLGARQKLVRALGADGDAAVLERVLVRLGEAAHGAEQHRDVGIADALAVLQPFLGDQPANFGSDVGRLRRDAVGLLLLLVQHAERRLHGQAVVRPGLGENQRLGRIVAAGVFRRVDRREHGVDELGDAAVAAEIFAQEHRLPLHSAVVGAAVGLENLRLGVAEAVDALLDVADHKAVVRLGNRRKNQILQAVYVLIFVDADFVERVLQFPTEGRADITLLVPFGQQAGGQML